MTIKDFILPPRPAKQIDFVDGFRMYCRQKQDYSDWSRETIRLSVVWSRLVSQDQSPARLVGTKHLAITAAAVRRRKQTVMNIYNQR